MKVVVVAAVVWPSVNVKPVDVANDDDDDEGDEPRDVDIVVDDVVA